MTVRTRKYVVLTGSATYLAMPARRLSKATGCPLLRYSWPMPATLETAYQLFLRFHNHGLVARAPIASDCTVTHVVVPTEAAAPRDGAGEG
jgi:hypothetical protein